MEMKIFVYAARLQQVRTTRTSTMEMIPYGCLELCRNSASFGSSFGSTGSGAVNSGRVRLKLYLMTMQTSPQLHFGGLVGIGGVRIRMKNEQARSV